MGMYATLNGALDWAMRYVHDAYGLNSGAVTDAEWELASLGQTILPSPLYDTWYPCYMISTGHLSNHMVHESMEVTCKRQT